MVELGDWRWSTHQRVICRSMGVGMNESALQGRCGQLKPFLPARPAIRQASRTAVRCTASKGDEENVRVSVARRASLLGLLGLGLAADAQAASNPLAQKKDPYTVRERVLAPAAALSTLQGLHCLG